MSDRVEYMQNAPDMQYRDRVDIKIIFNNQVQRCLQAIGTEYFPETVEALARILPTASYEKVMNRKGEWVTEVEDFEYTYDGPIWFGTPDKPLMKLKPNGLDEYPTPYTKDEEGNKIIDWSNPNIVSPRLMTKEKEDHMLFMRFILEEAENVNITWRSDPNNAEYGLYPEEEMVFDPPTPVYEIKKKLPLEPERSKHITWIIFENKLHRVTNFRGYAVGIDEGEKPWFFNEIAIRQAKQEPIVMMITATQGKGKTYFGKRLAQIFDKHFNPDKQIVMERAEITHLVSGRSSLKRDQVILIDESQFGASARNWGDKDQQALMNFLAAARFYGFIIIIVALHRSMLDTIIRERIVNYHIVMEERGKATVYEVPYQRFDEIKYPARRGTVTLQLPDYDVCSATTCLTCKERDLCMTIRARYERKKRGFVQGEAGKREDKAKQRITDNKGDMEYEPILIEHIMKLNLTQKGYIEPTSIQSVIQEETGDTISIARSKRLRSIMQIKHKDLIQKRKDSLV